MRSRLAAVSGTNRQLLDTASVIGRAFDFDTLQQASGRGEEESVVALEELIAQGLVKDVVGSEPSGSLLYDFSHEQLRSVVYQETSLARRRLLHRRVGEALVSRPRNRPEPGPSAGAVAQHFRAAGRDAKAAHYFKLAGDHARGLFANAEALGHYRSALALGHAEAAALHEAIGDLETLMGEYAEAIASYETGAALGGSRYVLRDRR